MINKSLALKILLTLLLLNSNKGQKQTDYSNQQ